MTKTKPVGCPAAPPNPEDRRQDKTKLVIANYNVDFLMTDPAKSGTLQCPGTGCDWPNVTIAMDHLHHVAEEIQKLDADIIALEETRDCDILNQLIALMPNMGYKPYMVLGTDTYTGQNPGILTRIDPFEDLFRSDARVTIPVDGSTCNSASFNIFSSTTGCSKHFRARFNVEGLKKPLTMIGTHLLAIPDEKSRCPEREGQGAVLAQMVSNATKHGDEVVVLGDFNDYDESVLDSNNNVPISSTLRIIREAGGLTNIANNILPQSERYSDWYDKSKDCIDHGGDEHSLIDHQLVSQGLFSKLKTVSIDHSYGEKCLCLYSDHWPLVAVYDLSTAERKADVVLQDQGRGTDGGSLIAMSMAAYPVINYAATLHKEGTISDYDLVGIYLLSLAASRKPRGWCNGPLKDPIVPPDTVGRSVPLEEVNGLVPLLGGDSFLEKKLGRPCNVGITVQCVFNELSLSGIKGNKDGVVVNTCVIEWGLGRRPCRLMTCIPSPMTVLRQQARGERVVTVFLKESELQTLQTSPLLYMDGAPSHTRDAFEFTLHDLMHMEHFVDERIHLEQRGFFASMLRLCDGKPRDFFVKECGLDELLWKQLEYVISDMNCFVPHLLQYTLAKVITAVGREGLNDSAVREGRIRSIWLLFLDSIGMNACPARPAGEAVLNVALKRRPEQPHLMAEEGEALRTFFQSVGV